MFIFRHHHTTIFLLVYVDDILITRNCSANVTSLITTLQSEFSIKDLGSLNHFLGIQVSHSGDSLFLTQTQYIKTILDRAHITDAKPCKTPMDSGLKLSKFSGQTLLDPMKYRMTVGFLQYATLTRPDISFVVNKVSQFMAAPTGIHWQAVKHILRYLKGTIHHGIQLQRSSSLSYCILIC
jgi:Reverse transcriptase (RNA-dependent DNA polymerase)